MALKEILFTSVSPCRAKISDCIVRRISANSKSRSSILTIISADGIYYTTALFELGGFY